MIASSANLFPSKFSPFKAKDYPNIYKAALPDTLVWRNPLGFNEDMVNNYLRHPAFENHPVVGVSWKQATNFAKMEKQFIIMSKEKVDYYFLSIDFQPKQSGNMLPSL